MPSQKRTPIGKQHQPRRTHHLGGCATCRKRHLKCDQTRPECTVCRKAGFECGGYPSQIRWASLSTGPRTPAPYEKPQPADANAPKRRDQDTSSNTPMITQNDAQVSKQLAPTKSIEAVSTASNAVLAAPDTQAIEQNLDFDLSSVDGLEYASTDLLSDLDSLFQSSSRLGWNDLFESSMMLSLSAIPNSGSLCPGDFESFDIAQSNTPNLSEQSGVAVDCHNFQNHRGTEIGSLDTVSNQQPPFCIPDGIDEAEVLTHAQFLLRYFRDTIIPQFSPLPMHTRSPWELLNLGAAVRTLADMTYLRGTGVTHASQANLFAILGCSAHNLTKTLPCPDTLSYEKGVQIVDYVARRAKEHMQESLKSETSGMMKAKYKDQMLAILSLIALTSLRGMSTDARCYLIDAERLVRLRGLAKREFSRRVRLVHHVYTWCRIIGESAFVLHDHGSHARQNRLREMLQNDRFQNVSPVSQQDTAVREQDSELDDFLRIESHGTDSETDTDSLKNPEIGFRDIHLTDSRPFAPSLYVEVYGIPEIWLSLVSQVTRVANIMDLLESSSVQAPQAFTSSFQRKIGRLEHRICSFAVQHNMSRTLSSIREASTEAVNTNSKRSVAGRHMLRAMSSALVIFFYRRIRKVHPWILQAHVNDVIAALTEFDAAQQGNNPISPGTPWAAFIAGCEAMSPSLQDWLIAWLEKGASQSAFNGFTQSQNIMREVWAQRDAAEKGNSHDTNEACSRKKGEPYSWVDVLRQSNSWLMLY